MHSLKVRWISRAVYIVGDVDYGVYIVWFMKLRDNEDANISVSAQ